MKSELLVPVLRINVISNFGCRSLCTDFLPPSSGVFRLSLAGSWPGIPCRRSFGSQGSMKACRKHIIMKQKFLGSIPSGFQWILGESQGKTGSNSSGFAQYWMNQRRFSKNEFFSKKFAYSASVKIRSRHSLCAEYRVLAKPNNRFWSRIWKIWFKTCELAPTRPACCGCKLENFFAEK